MVNIFRLVLLFGGIALYFLPIFVVTNIAVQYRSNVKWCHVIRAAL